MTKKKLFLSICILLYSFHFQFSTTYAESLSLVAPSAIVIDAATGIPLYEKDAHQKNYPASITKVMTALVALDAYHDNLQEKISFSAEAVDLPWDSSSIGMYAGDSLTVEQALYGLLMASANEIANALAEHLGGSVENFVRMMNEKATALGAVDTHFANPHGLHDPEHYTTAYDMALIMRTALQYPEFIQIISTRQTQIPPTEMQPLPRPLNNSNKLLYPGKSFYEYALGGKTGFTNEAQHTLVSYSQKDETGLIAVVLHDEKNAAYSDSIALFDYGFQNFGQVEVFNGQMAVKPVPLVQNFRGAETCTGLIEVAPEKNLTAFLPLTTDVGKISQVAELPASLSAPVKPGDIVGKVLLSYGDKPLGEVNLLAQNTGAFLPLETIAARTVPLSTGSQFPVKMLSAIFISFLATLVICVFTIGRFRYNQRRTRYRRTKLKKMSAYNARNAVRNYRYR